MDWSSLFFSFDGRINRAKWWLSVLVFVILSLVIWLVVLPLVGVSVWQASTTAGAVASLIVTLIFAYPGTAVMVKRLHDRDHPSSWAIIFWLPAILSILGQLFGITATPMEVNGQTVLMPTTLGWIVNLISAAIAIWALVEFGILKGTTGPNQYGPDPLAGR